MPGRATLKHLELVGLENHGAHKFYNRDSSPVIPRDATLKIPSEYSKETRKAWKSVVQNLINQQVLTENDLPSLKMLFDTYDDYVKARENYKAYNAMFDASDPTNTRKMVEIQRTLFATMNMARNEFNSLASRFGLTPVDRTKLPINQPEPKTEDPLAVVLGD
mgnify:CR=1 FL=1